MMQRAASPPLSALRRHASDVDTQQEATNMSAIMHAR